jgi:hypothetical protein
VSTQLPARLFKYQAFAPNSLANIKQASVWFSAPSRFNDPFDCALSIVKTDLSDRDFGRALEYVRRAGQMVPELEAEMYRDGETTTRFREITVESIQKVFEERRTIQSHHRGVACFSAKSDDLLMWSHYSQGHRGFCLEFDTSVEPFSKAKPVVYRDDVPVINPIDILDRTDNGELLDAMVYTKATCWSYEQEWRLLHIEANKLYTYDYRALTGVYFGAAMPFPQKEIISLILRGAPTQLYEMARAVEGFRLFSRPVSYTPPDYR